MTPIVCRGNVIAADALAVNAARAAADITLA